MTRSRRLIVVLCVGIAAAGVGTGRASASATRLLDSAPAPALFGQEAPARSFQLAAKSLDFRPTGLARNAKAAWWGGPVVTSTGETVTILVSDAFGQDEATRLSWANFFAWLYHGTELSTLTIYQAPLEEVSAICGNPNAAGCYSPSARILVFPGDISPGIDADIGAHEYAHHIAANRRNDPWDSNDWGPKRWASYAGVCARTTAGTAFPGDEGGYYTLNPGEAFAEAYRILNVQRGGTWANLPLIVDPSFTPDAGALAAALADATQPWLSPAATSWDGQFATPKPPTTKLRGAVGPDATISLETTTGMPFRSMKEGPFAITVRDSSAKDNFHLTGADINRKTSVSGKGAVVWKLELRPGIYHYRSDAHPKLRGSFEINVALFRGGASAHTPSSSASFPPQDRALPTLLDGSFQATVSGTAGARLELIDPATGQDLVAPAIGTLSFTICGQRSLVLRATADTPGSLHVAIASP